MIRRMLDAVRKALFIEMPPTLEENRERAVERARAAAARPARYVLGAGGRDPRAASPLTKRNNVLGSDCVGFTSWALGHDRYQPETFELYDGWINTDSLMLDARGARQWYEQIDVPEPGDVVVFPSIHRDGRRVRMGHVALVVEVPVGLPAGVFALPADERRKWLRDVYVVDCAAAASRGQHAIHETTAAASWDKPDAMWARCRRAP